MEYVSVYDRPCPPLLHWPSSSPCAAVKRGVACRLANQTVAPYDLQLLSVFDPCLHVHFQPGLHLTYDLHDDLDQVGSHNNGHHKGLTSLG
jgi:hypothetical protein